jgi:Lrp/AsnC family leucine-responsive transcriptional regulator
VRNNHQVMAALDEIDCALLALLQDQGDIPNVALARVRAIVRPEEVGLLVEAYVLVTLSEHAPEADARFAREVAHMPNVLRADSVAGAEDALLHVAARSPADLHRLLLALKRAGAARLTTMLRLQAIKPPAPVPT